MQNNTPPNTPSTSPLEDAFKNIAHSVAASIVNALVEPLRQEIEAKVNELIAEATKDVHTKIAAAIGQIQPINIPINLFAQPVVQMPQVVTTPPAPVIPQPVAPVPATPASQSSVAKDIPIADVDEPDNLLADPDDEDLVNDEVEENLSEQTAHQKQEPSHSVVKTKKRKNFTATIVGLLPGQAHMIKNEFKFAKLSFVSSNVKNSSQLVSLSKNKNLVIFMTDFIRHAAVESVRAVNGNWIYITGGLSSLREKLQELCLEHRNQAGFVAGTSV